MLVKTITIKSLLVSVLTMGRLENIQQQLQNLPNWLADFSRSSGISVHIVIRNNDPNVSFDAMEVLLDATMTEHPELQVTLISGGPNVGFGAGHNANFRFAPADAVLILNDDIGFPHLSWLDDAVKLLGNGDGTALVGARDNPQNINPYFGNGTFPSGSRSTNLKYTEASVLLASGAAFTDIGMFNEHYDWAMCEDADLSLRAQQHGYKLAWLHMPHQHWRSSSFNALPSPVRASILEHNRATLFSCWRESFASGRIGKYDVFDLWSEGIGDTFCALPHLRAALIRMTPSQRSLVVVNTPEPHLVALIGQPEVQVISCADRGELQACLGNEGVSTIRSTRHINYSLPFHMHSLVCGALGLSAASTEDYEGFRACLRDRIMTDDLPGKLTPGTYCVVHLEFLRSGHDGRSLSPNRAQELVRICSELFDTVVIIGKEKRFLPSTCDSGRSNIVDLQGRLSSGMLISVVSHAGFFVGVDSYPSHVAQAAGVRTAIFFGSVHPLTRIWNERLSWPLVAPLDCIGCYHTHLELSVPFCMRRDEACTSDIVPSQFREALEAMIAGSAYDWSHHRGRLRKLEAKALKYLGHHPAPPHRLFRDQPTGNEQISNLIYDMTDRMADLLRDRYKAADIATLSSRVAELEVRNYAKDADLESAKRQNLRHEGEIRRLKTALRLSNRRPTRVVPIVDFPWEGLRCEITTGEQSLEVYSEEEDPQIILPNIEAEGGLLRLQLTCAADHETVFELFWARGDETFSEQQKTRVSVGAMPIEVRETFTLDEGESFRIRIDPVAGLGRAQISGSLSGAFHILEKAGGTEPAPIFLAEALGPLAAESSRSEDFANGFGEGSEREPGTESEIASNAKTVAAVNMDAKTVQRAARRRRAS